MLNLYGNDDWSVVQPATEDPTSDDFIPSEEAEANFISNEFINVWDQADKSVICVPKTFPLSENPTDGEKAEKKVFDVLKEAGTSDPDLRMVIFSGLRSTGPDDKNSGLKLIREIDNSVLLEYKKKKSTSYFEIKCCDKESGLKQHRKKAANQLNKVKMVKWPLYGNDTFL